jgi:hypothetical protein
MDCGDVSDAHNDTQIMDYMIRFWEMKTLAFSIILNNQHNNHQHLLALLSYLQSNDYRFVPAQPAIRAVNAGRQAYW